MAATSAGYMHASTIFFNKILAIWALLHILTIFPSHNIHLDVCLITFVTYRPFELIITSKAVFFLAKRASEVGVRLLPVDHWAIWRQAVAEVSGVLHNETSNAGLSHFPHCLFFS